MKKLITATSLVLAFTTFFLTSCQTDKNIDDVTPAIAKDSIESEEANSYNVGITKTLIAGQDTIPYKEVDGKKIFQGDIMLTDAQMEEMKDPKQTEGIYTLDLADRWPKGIVYYELDPSVNKLYGAIFAAMSHYSVKTGISFTQRNNKEKDYIYITEGELPASYIGRVEGKQDLTLTPSSTTGTIMHEFGHAVGLAHEHCRHDRDKSITIKWENISNDIVAKAQFATYDTPPYSTFNTYGALDFNSIMMYGSFFGSKNKKPTMVKKNGSTFARSNVLSKGDIATIKKMYPNLIIPQK